MTFKKTSVVHQDIGEHEHEIIINDSYEMYAFCNKCGLHDWSVPEGYNEDTMRGTHLLHFLAKYPNAKRMDVEGIVHDIPFVAGTVDFSTLRKQDENI